jgi:hypothetical protein
LIIVLCSNSAIAQTFTALSGMQAREDEFKGELSKMRFLLEQTRSGHAADLAAAKHAFEADVQVLSLLHPSSRSPGYRYAIRGRCAGFEPFSSTISFSRVSKCLTICFVRHLLRVRACLLEC